MPIDDTPTAVPADDAATPDARGAGGAATRKRPKPGERREQILQTLAAMLESPGADRVTTAALAARIQVSEAALYRHFASKAQMFEALIEFIEQTVFSRVTVILDEPAPAGSDPRAEGLRQAYRVVALVVQFAEKNPGMARVMVGDALVLEHERLQQRMTQFFERIESTLRQCLRHSAQAVGSTTPTVDANVQASVLAAFTAGRLQRFVRSGFRRLPSDQLDASLQLML